MAADLADFSFAVGRRGYDRDEVEGALHQLGDRLAAMSSARDVARQNAVDMGRQVDAARGQTEAGRTTMDEMRGELNQLRSRVAELSTIPSSVSGMSERLQQMVRVAQDEANELRSRATTSASHVLMLAQAEADELRDRSEVEHRQFEAERHAAEEELRVQTEETRSRLAQLRADSGGRKARLDVELAGLRAGVERQLAVEVEGRRAGLMEQLGSLESRQRSEVARMVDVTDQDARGRVAAATGEAERIQVEARNEVAVAQRELDELFGLRRQVSEQLTSVRALLDWTLPQMAPALDPA